MTYLGTHVAAVGDRHNHADGSHCTYRYDLRFTRYETDRQELGIRAAVGLSLAEHDGRTVNDGGIYTTRRKAEA